MNELKGFDKQRRVVCIYH